MNGNYGKYFYKILQNEITSSILMSKGSVGTSSTNWKSKQMPMRFTSKCWLRNRS